MALRAAYGRLLVIVAALGAGQLGEGGHEHIDPIPAQARVEMQSARRRGVSGNGLLTPCASPSSERVHADARIGKHGVRIAAHFSEKKLPTKPWIASPPERATWPAALLSALVFEKLLRL